MSSPSPRGRRPGSPDTRATVLAAARDSFAAAGFAGTTVRGVAAAAGVDAALVHHYFGTKHELFLAAVELPVDPRTRLAPVVAGGPDGAGTRLLRAFLGAWDDPELQPGLVAAARTVVAPGGDRLLRNAFIPAILAPTLGQLMPDRQDDRLALVVSQVLGLVLARYVMKIEPLASLPAEQVVTEMGPTLQRYFTGDLT